MGRDEGQGAVGKLLSDSGPGAADAPKVKYPDAGVTVWFMACGDKGNGRNGITG